MKKKFILCFIVLFAAILGAKAQKNYQLKSPDGKLEVQITVGDKLTYLLLHNGMPIITDSEISLTLADGAKIDGKNAHVVKKKSDFISQKIETPFYTKNQIDDTYRIFELKLNAKWNIEFRAYNDGFAYRFKYFGKMPETIAAESANFNFADNYKMYAAYSNSKKKGINKQFNNSFENTYQYKKITEQSGDSLMFLPVLVDLPEGKKLCITEADLYNYPGMFLNNSKNAPALKGVFAPCPKTEKQGGHNNLQMLVVETENFIAKNVSGNLPWRIIIISENDAALANCDMVYRLAEQNRLTDISWIKPGKVAWDWWNAWNIYGVDFEAGINTETYKYYIDFASNFGIEYVILDEGWAVNKQADLMQVVPEINLPEILNYAKQKNVGIILWAGYYAFERDMENIAKHYAAMGVKGFKIDFMNRDDQKMTKFLYDAADICARNKMVVDFHGIYKPTGLIRTYPNVLNYEGVAGLEQMKWAKDMDMVSYDVLLPFIRMVAGPMDYTQGAMRNATKDNFRAVNSEPMSQGTRCRQLAEYVVFFSPLNMMCDNPSNYMREKECTKFIASVPTTWDETKVLAAKIGEYIAVARRAGNTWYIGAITNWDAREITIDVSFIKSGNLKIELFRDGINANRNASDYKKENITANNGKLVVKCAPGGGFAAKITND